MDTFILVCRSVCLHMQLHTNLGHSGRGNGGGSLMVYSVAMAK